MDTKGGKWWGWGGGMNWEIGIDMYTLICIKWITNKNLLYKKINKIKFENSTKKKISRDTSDATLAVMDNIFIATLKETLTLTIFLPE